MHAAVSSAAPADAIDVRPQHPPAPRAVGLLHRLLREPQIIEELKRTSPEGGGEQAALKQPHNTAGRDRQQ